MKKGFTLIELLVVVLIIGILAAIALPQYQKAVAKSRLVGLISIMKGVKTAQDLYYMNNNKYALTFDELDLGFPCDSVVEAADGAYCYSNNKKNVLKIFNTIGFYYKADKYTLSYQRNQEGLRCQGDTAVEQAVCKSYGGTQIASGDTPYDNIYIIQDWAKLN
ncbi:prepilin-type N-terminal cleavage/methylation domain-containing protein [Elusimicrobium posterum]|uniref:type IV pilin protein n=1 Tax=Elusimicrobium posterum TaxID=3116653 RepID=UPI003C754A3D